MRNIACLLLFAGAGAACAPGVQGAGSWADDARATPADFGQARDLLQARPPDAAPQAAPDLRSRDPGKLFGKATLTYYWLAEQTDYPGSDDTILCDVSARTIATVPLAFAKALQIEGSGRLTGGQVLNIGGSCSCPSGMTTCYIELDTARYPWGLAADGQALMPYRSIAVDRSQITLRTPGYILEFDGVPMPGAYGFVSDGCVKADDVGGHILGAHVDFFVGEKSSYLALDKGLGLSDVTVYLDPPRCP